MVSDTTSPSAVEAADVVQIAETAEAKKSSDIFLANEGRPQAFDPYAPDTYTTQNHESTLDPGPSPYLRIWSPLALRLVFTVAFVIYVLALIALLETFIRLSPYPLPSRPGVKFAWTYMPTACIMVVEWVWASYEVQIRLLTPWDALCRGVSPAKVWEWDYIGWNYFMGLWKAIRNFHLGVLLCYLGVWLVALAGVASTSLWAIRMASTSPSANLVLTSQLLVAPIPFLSKVNTLDSEAPFITPYLGHLIYGLPRAQWIAAGNILVEPFSLPDDSPYAHGAATLSGQTKGYSSSLSCDSAAASFRGDFMSTTNPKNSTGYLVDIEAAGCTQTYNLTWVDYVPPYNAMGRPNLNASGFVWDFGFVFNHTCPGSSSVAVEALFHIGAIACTQTYLEHLMMVNVTLEPTTSVEATLVPGSSKPYTFDGGNSLLQWIDTINASTLSMVPRFALDPFQDWTSDAAGDPTAVTDGYNVSYTPWIWLLAHSTNCSQDDLRDAGKLQSMSTAVFESLWPDFAMHTFMTNSSSSQSGLPTIEGVVRVNEEKLLTHPLSVRLAQGALSALILVTIVIYIVRPRPVLPRDPSSLVALAALLSRKKGAVDPEHGSDEKAVNLALRRRQLRYEEGLASVRASDATISPLRQEQSADLRLWRPLILHPISGVILIVVVIGTIIALQLTYRYSVVHHGFAESDVGSIALQTLRTYVAPIYIFLLIIMLSSYLMAIQLLESYNAMARSPTPARSSVLYAPASYTHIGLLWHAAWHRSLVGLLCAAVFVILPFLKIAVAGLLVTTAVQQQMTVAVNSTGTFNNTLHPVWFGIGPNGTVWETALSQGCPSLAFNCPLPGYTTMMSQLPQYGLALPPWVTTTDAVGEVNLDQLDILQQAGNVTVHLPTVSAELSNCTALPTSYYNHSIGYIGNVGNYPGLILQLPPSLNPVTCSPANNWACPAGQTPFQLSIDLPQVPGYFGEANALYSRPMFYFGKTSNNNATLIANLTVIKCDYGIILSTKQVTIASVNSSSAPLLSVNQSSVQDPEVIAGPGITDDDLPYPVFPLDALPTNATQAFDLWTQVITQMEPSLSLDDFLDPTNHASVAQKLWTAYWANYVSVFMRLPVNGSNADVPDQILEGLVQLKVTRIGQGLVPTRIIQALLGAVLLFGLAASVLMRSTTKVLPFSPYSIGAQMRLVLESRFAELRVLGENMNDRELERALSHYKFALGWSSGADGLARYGVDIVDNLITQLS